MWKRSCDAGQANSPRVSLFIGHFSVENSAFLLLRCLERPTGWRREPPSSGTVEEVL